MGTSRYKVMRDVVSIRFGVFLFWTRFEDVVNFNGNLLIFECVVFCVLIISE